MLKRAVFERSRRELSLDVLVGVHILLVEEQSSLESQSRGCAKTPKITVCWPDSTVVVEPSKFPLERLCCVLVCIQSKPALREVLTWCTTPAAVAAVVGKKEDV